MYLALSLAMETTWRKPSRIVRRLRRIAIVTTRGAGSGRSYGAALDLAAALRSRGHHVVVHDFPNLDVLRGWAQTGGVPCSLLVCIGGDGTLNAAVAAALRQCIPFLPVPSGFGNLFAGALRQPRRVDQVIELIDDGALIRVDVGQYKSELFLCQQSFGLLQQIQDSAEDTPARPRTRWLRSLSYYQTALRQALKDGRLPRFAVTIDGQFAVRDAVIVTVSNVPTYGSWLKLTPAASPVDGLFDVFVMRGRAKGEILSRLLTQHLHLAGADDGMFVWRGRHVIVAAPHRDPDEIVLRRRCLTVVTSPRTATKLLHGQASIDRSAGGIREVA